MKNPLLVLSILLVTSCVTPGTTPGVEDTSAPATEIVDDVANGVGTAVTLGTGNPALGAAVGVVIALVGGAFFKKRKAKTPPPPPVPQ